MLMMMVMVMTLLFAVMMFSSRFGVHVRHDHFSFFTNNFAVTSSIIRVIEGLLARGLCVMVMVTLAALRLFRIT